MGRAARCQISAPGPELGDWHALALQWDYNDDTLAIRVYQMAPRWDDECASLFTYEVLLNMPQSPGRET